MFILNVAVIALASFTAVSSTIICTACCITSGEVSRKEEQKRIREEIRKQFAYQNGDYVCE